MILILKIKSYSILGTETIKWLSYTKNIIQKSDDRKLANGKKLRNKNLLNEYFWAYKIF